jgi:hypothetical protein
VIACTNEQKEFFPLHNIYTHAATCRMQSALQNFMVSWTHRAASNGLSPAQADNIYIIYTMSLTSGPGPACLGHTPNPTGQELCGAFLCSKMGLYQG